MKKHFITAHSLLLAVLLLSALHYYYGVFGESIGFVRVFGGVEALVIIMSAILFSIKKIRTRTLKYNYILLGIMQVPPMIAALGFFVFFPFFWMLFLYGLFHLLMIAWCVKLSSIFKNAHENASTDSLGGVGLRHDQLIGDLLPEKEIQKVKQKKTYVFIGLGTAMAVILTGIILLDFIGTSPRRIELPSAEAVTRIEMAQIDGRHIQSATVTEKNDIELVLDLLSTAKRSRLSSLSAANDNPLRPDYVNVGIIVEHEEYNGQWSRLYLYSELDRVYVFVPYVGIYRTAKKLSEEFYQMYAMP